MRPHASVAVTAGNKHDGFVAHRLIRRATVLIDDIQHALGDTACGGAEPAASRHLGTGIGAGAGNLLRRVSKRPASAACKRVGLRVLTFPERC